MIAPGGGSVAVGAALRAADALRIPAAAAARCLDAAAAALTSPGPRAAAAGILLVPAARLLLPGPAGSAAAILTAGILVLALLLRCAAALHADGERRIVLRVLLLGAAVRALAAVALAAAGGLPDEHGYYHPFAKDAAECWSVGGPSLLAEHPFVEGRAAYHYLLAGTYLVLGPEMAAGRLLGAGLGLLAALLAGELARAWGGARAAAMAVAVLALHPEHGFWSATLSRDTFSTVLVLAALVLLVRDPPALLRRDLWLAGVPLALLSRNGLLPAAALAGAALLAGTLAARSRGTRAAAAIALLASVVAVGHRWGPWLRPSMLSSVRQGLDMRRALSGGAGDADFLPGWIFAGPLDLVLYAPLGAAFVLLAPLPWEAASLERLLYGPFWCAGAAISILGIAGLAAAARRAPSRAVAPVAFAVLLLGLLVALEANTGIVVRHRLPLTAVLAAGAGVLLAVWRDPRGCGGLPTGSRG